VTPAVPDPPTAAELDAQLTGTIFAGRAVLAGVVDSTIDTCRALADEGAPEGACVIAAGQRRGRGRPGHAWFSPAGGALYLSALLRPSLPAADVALLTPLAGVAACLAVREGFGVPAILRRPNDLVVPDWSGASPSGWRKLGGVLVDTAIQGATLRHAIVSVGINVALQPADFPPALRTVATSLWQETGVAYPVASVAGAFLRRLHELRREMDARPERQWRSALLARHEGLARDIPEMALPASAWGAP
jgi:BirA family biotin operon repressor/biotin-[acetyl-CoA-carboxylase] ligase